MKYRNALACYLVVCILFGSMLLILTYIYPDTPFIAWKDYGVACFVAYWVHLLLWIYLKDELVDDYNEK